MGFLFFLQITFDSFRRIFSMNDRPSSKFSLKISHFVALQDGDSLSVADLPSLPFRIRWKIIFFGTQLFFLLIIKNKMIPRGKLTNGEARINAQTCRSKMEKFRVIEWKNDWKLLHGRDTVTRFPSRTLQKSDRVTSIAKFHRPRFFRFSTPRLELKEFLPSTPYL